MLHPQKPCHPCHLLSMMLKCWLSCWCVFSQMLQPCHLLSMMLKCWLSCWCVFSQDVAALSFVVHDVKMLTVTLVCFQSDVAALSFVVHDVKMLTVMLVCFQSGCSSLVIVQELCESWGGHPGLSVLMSLLVSVDVKLYWTMLRHWSQLVPNMSTDIWGH